MNADAPDARVENDAADGTLERDAGKPAALPATPADDEAEGDSDSDETSEMTMPTAKSCGRVERRSTQHERTRRDT